MPSTSSRVMTAVWTSPALQLRLGVDGLHVAAWIAPVDLVVNHAVGPAECVLFADCLGSDGGYIAGSTDKLDEPLVADDQCGLFPIGDEVGAAVVRLEPECAAIHAAF
jgi:hypothetical protein